MWAWLLVMQIATIDKKRKLGEGCAPFRGELRPHVTQRCLSRTKWHLDPSSRLATIGAWAKIGRGVSLPFFQGVPGSPSNTKSPEPRPVSIPSGILVHPRTLAKIWELCPFREGEMGPHLTQCGVGEAFLLTKWYLDP